MSDGLIIGADKAGAPGITGYWCGMDGVTQRGTGATPEEAYDSFIEQRIFRLRFAWNTITPPNRSAVQ